MHRNGSDPTDHRDERNDTPGGPTLEPGRGYRSFAPVPEDLILDLAVEPLGLRIWCVFDRQARGRPVAMDSMTKLAAKLGCSPDTARRAVAKLAKTGWLDVEHVAGRTSRYVVHYEKPVTGVSPNGGPGKSARGGKSASTPLAAVPGHTRAIPGLREDLEGEVPAAPPPPQLEPEQQPPTYVGRCPKHAHHPDPPDCRGCMRARIAHEKTQADEAAAAPADVLCPTHLVQHDPRAECRSCRSDRLAGDDHSAELNPAAAVGGAFADNITRSTERFTAGFATSSSPARSTPARSARSMSSGSATGPLTSRST